MRRPRFNGQRISCECFFFGADNSLHAHPCLMTLCTLTRLRVCDPRVVMRSEVCQGWNYHLDYI